MKFKVIGRKDDRLICEDDWIDDMPMPIRGDSFTFDGGPLMRIMECIFIMEKGKIARVSFLAEEDIPSRVQPLR